jgi:dihydrofolate reductase
MSSIVFIATTLDGYKHLSIDVGVTVKSFLKDDLIDATIITVIPILLGGGIFLFGELSRPMDFEHLKTEIFLRATFQNH